MISSKNEWVFIRDLADLTFQIIFNAWWASMNVGSKSPIAWNHSRHAPSLRFYLHCSIEETGSPGIIYLICHPVLRHPSEHGTSSRGQSLPAKAHIAKLKKLTESEVSEFTSSTINETALAIVKMKGSREIPIARLQKEIHIRLFRRTYIDSLDRPNAPNWQQSTSQQLNVTKTPGIVTSW